MSITSWMQHHRRSLLAILLMLIAGGTAAALGMPVSLFPHVNFPRVVVTLDAGDRPAEQMMTEVTIPVEEAVRSVPGVLGVRSKTSRGSAEMSVGFGWRQDMIVALLQMQSAITEISARLPAGTEFTVRRMDPTVFPILGFTLVSDRRSLVELRDLALMELRPALTPVAGVARVEVLGGAQEEIRVAVDPARLQARGLAMDDVAAALAAWNVIEAVGRVEDHFKLYLVMTSAPIASADDVAAVVLHAGPGGMVRLGDVAIVSRETVPQWTRVTADGCDAVIIQVYQQTGANTLRLAADAGVALASLTARLPADVRVSNWYDQSRLVRSSAVNVLESVLIGMGLAALVLLIFLRNLKVTLVATVTVPSVLAACCLLLYVLGASLNIMTLGGMAAAVGLIIDDAIVMVEHIIRRLRDKRAGAGGTHHGRVMKAAAEFTRPLIGASGATIIIYLPPAFLTGVTGEFFKALSLTMAVSLIISFLVAWIAVPLMADWLLTQRDADQPEGGPVAGLLGGAFAWTLALFLRRRWLALVLLAPVAVAGWVGYSHVRSGFMPAMDEGGFVLDYFSTPGTSLSETDRLLRRVEAILRDTPEVQTYSRRTGLQLGGGITEANEGDFFVRLKARADFPARRPIEAVMDDVRTRVESTVPGLRIELLQLIEDIIGDLTAVPQPIEIKLFSDDYAQLLETAPRVAAALEKLPGVVDINNGLTIAGDALEIHVDPVRAAAEGLDAAKVTRAVADLTSGAVATHFLSPPPFPKLIGVRVWVPSTQRSTELDLERLRIGAPDGRMVPLDRVATVRRLSGQPQITRDNLRRVVAVTARTAGTDLGTAIREVRGMLDQPDLLPPGLTVSLGGLYEQQQSAFAGLLAVFGAAVALVFLLLLFLYESLRVAASLIAVSLMAMPAVVVGLWVTGTELNITSMMGLAMIVGSITEVGVFYCSELFSRSEAGHRDDDAPARLLAAGIGRLRPIAMTTIAATLAMMPLAIGLGEGASMLRPLAIAIVSGLLVQLPLVLLVLPVVLSLTRATHRRRRGHEGAALHAGPQGSH